MIVNVAEDVTLRDILGVILGYLISRTTVDA